MKNMAMSAEEREQNCAPSSLSGGGDEGPRYPYGLCICLEEESLQKLGIKNLPGVGESMMITAKVMINSTSENESQHSGIRRSLSLQITDLELGKQKKEVDINKLYDKKEESEIVTTGKMYGKLNDNPNENGG